MLVAVPTGLPGLFCYVTVMVMAKLYVRYRPVVFIYVIVFQNTKKTWILRVGLLAADVFANSECELMSAAVFFALRSVDVPVCDPRMFYECLLTRMADFVAYNEAQNCGCPYQCRELVYEPTVSQAPLSAGVARVVAPDETDLTPEDIISDRCIVEVNNNNNNNNNRGYSVPTGSALTVFQCSHGKVARLSVGMWLSCPLADSYLSDAAREPGSVAELAASRKKAKYAVLDGRYMFVPIAFENLGVPHASAKLLLTHLGRRLSEKSRESRETSFLFQRCSVLLQRFNAVLLHDSVPAGDRMEF